MTTLLDSIRETADRIALKEYGKSYQELQSFEQDEIWMEAQIKAEEKINKQLGGYR